MDVKILTRILDATFYTGVPDSQLKALCDYLMDTYSIDTKHHIIAANEGNAVGLAAGYYLATGKVPVVYLQNSGIGNIINPVASLLNERVYGIPCVFIVGWRGEPSIHDEPQHVYQGMVTEQLLHGMEIETFILEEATTEDALRTQLENWRPRLAQGRSVAIIVRKKALTFDGKVEYRNENTMLREEIIRHVTNVSGEDVIVSTTGKASRELFEIREVEGRGHQCDFLTVGSMGHSTSIALGIALYKRQCKVWCIDGDGAALMHMGAMAVIGANKPKNMVHLVLNNGAHETVGGMPTVAAAVDFVAIAKACGYEQAYSVETFEELDTALNIAKTSSCLTFIEAKTAIGSRAELGRPTTTPQENKESFTTFLRHIDS